MTTESIEAMRLRMARIIVDFEARRDSKGRLAVYPLPAGDGGGSYEVAGINDRYHPAMAARLRGMINAGQHEAAEKAVAEYLVNYTDAVLAWKVSVPGIEFFLRDCVFNRGPTGAAKILQIALAVEVDGGVGPITQAALGEAAKTPAKLLTKLRHAREQYERRYAGRNEDSIFWKGLVNRWEKAVSVARTFPMEVPEAVMVDKPAAKPVSAQDTTQKPASTTEWLKNAVSRWFGAPKAPIQAPTVPQSAILPVPVTPSVAIPPIVIHHGDRGYTDADLSYVNFPPRPGFSPLVTTAERQKVFGKFEYRSAPTSGNPEAIQILGNWADKNIVRVEIPQLAHTRIVHAPQFMMFHRLAAEQLRGLFADWEAAGLLGLILTYEGSFVPRFIRGSRSTLSNHAFGTAFDINYFGNQLGTTPAKAGTKWSVRELVPIAHRWGFYWGGHFAGRPDGMHFEVAKIL